MILYTSLLDRGITVCPSLIIIPSWAKGNASFVAHELMHVSQQRQIGTLTFWWRYMTDLTQRQKFEVEAYKAQIAHGGHLEYCAGQLKNGYRLTLNFAQALQLLEPAPIFTLRQAPPSISARSAESL